MGSLLLSTLGGQIGRHCEVSACACLCSVSWYSIFVILRSPLVWPGGGYDLSIFGAKVTQDFPGGAGDLKILVPKSWYQNLKVGSWLLAPPTTLAFYDLNGVSP